MAYIAVKPCHFAGESFMIGDSIPAEYIQPGAEKRLVRMGLIAEADGITEAATKAAPETVTVENMDITIEAEGGEMTLTVSKEAIQNIFTILTGNVKSAEATIKEMDEDDALILLHMADARKSVKDLAETRAKELAEAKEAAENAAAVTDPEAGTSAETGAAPNQENEAGE